MKHPENFFETMKPVFLLKLRGLVENRNLRGKFLTFYKEMLKINECMLIY